MIGPFPFHMPKHRIAIFWDRVDKTETCWLWTRGKSTAGYGKFWNGERDVAAHNVAWLLMRGAFPRGLEPDHTCPNKHCVNPDHIEWVTPEENKHRRATRAIYCGAGLHRWDEQVPDMSKGPDGVMRRHCHGCRNIRNSKRGSLT